MSRSIVANGTPSQQASCQPATPTLAAIYARVSTEDQGKGYSLPTQGVPTKLDRSPIPGRKASRAGTWRTSAVHQVLSNETYVGMLHWNKYQYGADRPPMPRDRAEWLTIPVPAIVTPDIFAAARAKRASNKSPSLRNRRYEYLFLGGRLRCGRCLLAMIGYPNKGKLYYRCASAYRHHPDEPFCRGSARADEIEPQVWREIERVLRDPTLIMAELDRQEHQGAATQRDIIKERQAIQQALAALEREAQRWDKAYAGEVIDLTELKVKKFDITERKQRLLAQQEAVETAMQSAQQSQAKTRDILTYCLHVKERLHTLDMPYKRQALEALGIRVTWAPGEPIRINGSIPMDITISTAS